MMVVIAAGALAVATGCTWLELWRECSKAEPCYGAMTTYLVVGTLFSFALGSVLEKVLP